MYTGHATGSSEAPVVNDGDTTIGYRALIWFTIVGPVAFAAMIFYPPLLKQLGFAKECSHLLDSNFFYNILASFWLTMSAAGMLALRAPKKFSPIFLVQMLYKATWLVSTAVPAMLSGAMTQAQMVIAAIMLSVVLMDALFVPWDYVLAEDQ